MSGERDFDNYIKNGLDGYSAAVSPHIWDNIIEERRKRKPVGFWVNFLNTKNVALFVGAAVMIVSTLWVLNRSAKTKSAVQIANTSTILNQTNTLHSQGNKDISNTIPVLQKDKDQSKVLQSTGVLAVNRQQASADFDPVIIIKNDGEKELVDDNVINGLDNRILASRLLFDLAVPVSSVQSLAILQNRKFPNVFIPGCPTVEEAAAGNKKYVEVYFGPDFTLRNFTDTTAQSVYLQKRKASTEVSSAYSAGIRYTKVFKNGVSVKAGLNYSQINEKFTFIQSNLVQTTYIIDPVSGDTTGSYTVTGTRKKTTYNKYRTIDVPILVGYEIGNGRLHVNISAGAMLNLYSWQRGEVLDTNYLPVSITTGKSISSPYQFKTNVGVGLTGGIGVYYKLTDQLHILAEPYFRYNLQPMSKETLTLQQKYNTIGMRLGVRLDLK